MKKLIVVILISLISIHSFARKSTYSKLVEVNKCWQMQTDISLSQLAEHQNLSEKEWIVYHLSSVENTLRSRNSKHLQPKQLQNRLHCLDMLHAYWLKGNFPVNDRYNNRTPIFIDQYNNFCAVGFLIKETGHEGISRMIAANGNLAYVTQMQYPELMEWANENGFTKDELAWIQPGYGPEGICNSVGKGVDGYIQEMYVDEANQFLFIGGSFIQADKSVTANNVAYITETGGTYTYHNMGAGVDGKVNAITKFDKKIFVGGSFSKADGKTVDNIAVWDGTNWTNAGCLNGTVHDLIVYKDTLYAAGNFASCGSDTGKNFAKWNGASWTMIGGISGRINTMEVVKDNLLLGGLFNFDTAKNVNVIQWSPSTSFQKFPENIYNEVMDIDVYKDTIYAACKRLSSKDTLQPILKFDGVSWRNAIKFFPSAYKFNPLHGDLVVQTILIDSARLTLGGSFYTITSSANHLKYGSGEEISLDSTINKMVVFKNELICGGLFKNGVNSGSGGLVTFVEMNGIARQVNKPLSITNFSAGENRLKLYPNPIQPGEILSIENKGNADEYILSDLSGQEISKGNIKNGSLTVPPVAAGTYLLNIMENKNSCGSSTIVIQ